MKHRGHALPEPHELIFLSHTIAITMMSQHQTNFHHQLPKSFKCYKKKGKKKFCKHSLVSKYECENVKEKETD